MIIKHTFFQIRIDLILALLFYIFNSPLIAQNNISSDEAIIKYEKITEIMEQSFPENEYKTYRRDSFSEQELQFYLTKHFQRLDLLPYIDGEHAFKMHSYLHSGNWFKEIGFPKSSIKWYNIFFEYYDEKKDSLTVLEKEELNVKITYAYSVQASNYAKFGQLINADLVHKKNIKFVKGFNSVSNPSALNNYGLFFYRTKKELDSALIYFNRAYDITKENFPRHTLLGSIRDNIADIYIEKNQPEKALIFYKENYELYKQIKNEMSNKFDIPRLISAGTQLVESEIKLNLLVQANQSFIELQEIFENPKFKNEIRSSSKLEFFKTQEVLLTAQNNYKSAYEIASKRIRFSDSLGVVSKIADSKWRDELNTISLDRIALQFEIDKIQKETIIRSQQLKLWILAILSLSFLGFLSSLFLRRRQLIVNARDKQLLAEQEMRLTVLRNKQLKSDIRSKERDLSDFAINLTQNQEWAKVLAQKLDDLKGTKGRQRKKMLNSFESEIKSKIAFDIETKDFFRRLDKLSDTFYSQLNSQFPNLTKTEKRLCSLIRLKIDSYQISTLQNITLSSLNTSRYRLRKKINLSKDDDLDVFIQSL